MKFGFVSMAYIHMRSVSIFIFIVAIFIFQFLFITAGLLNMYWQGCDDLQSYGVMTTRT
ncbi:hypothetical protein HanRHA438_Chr17g0814551 [Helianthus annuus]|uniref:Uncharacterized protein n=1 Tax=Helianthus annuus TaxID=4232 RepID=A0A251RQ59_HELAN|nr:hypothetical protein HanRHA438_Chr17g0814551 [Helianthus annuus]